MVHSAYRYEAEGQFVEHVAGPGSFWGGLWVLPVASQNGQVNAVVTVWDAPWDDPRPLPEKGQVIYAGIFQAGSITRASAIPSLPEAVYVSGDLIIEVDVSALVGAEAHVVLGVYNE